MGGSRTGGSMHAPGDEVIQAVARYLEVDLLLGVRAAPVSPPAMPSAAPARGPPPVWVPRRPPPPAAGRLLRRPPGGRAPPSPRDPPPRSRTRRPYRPRNSPGDGG